jgi:hypothetical protein
MKYRGSKQQLVKGEDSLDSFILNSEWHMKSGGDKTASSVGRKPLKIGVFNRNI